MVRTDLEHEQSHVHALVLGHPHVTGSDQRRVVLGHRGLVDSSPMRSSRCAYALQARSESVAASLSRTPDDRHRCGPTPPTSAPHAPSRREVPLVTRERRIAETTRTGSPRTGSNREQSVALQADGVPAHCESRRLPRRSAVRTTARCCPRFTASRARRERRPRPEPRSRRCCRRRDRHGRCDPLRGPAARLRAAAPRRGHRSPRPA